MLLTAAAAIMRRSLLRQLVVSIKIILKQFLVDRYIRQGKSGIDKILVIASECTVGPADVHIGLLANVAKWCLRYLDIQATIESGKAPPGKGFAAQVAEC